MRVRKNHWMRPVLGLTLACALETHAADMPLSGLPSSDVLPASSEDMMATPASDDAIADTASGDTLAVSAVHETRWSVTASLGAISSSGTGDLDDRGERAGAAARVQTEWTHGNWNALGEVVGGSSALAYDGATAIRQAWVDYAHGPVQLRVGRQVIAWGRADRLNPTDNLSPRNLPALVADIDADRMGLDALSLRLQLGERWTLGVVHAARMPATVLPGAIADLPSQFGGRRVRDLSSSENLDALKLDFAGYRLDASISALEGPAPTSAFVATPLPAAYQPKTRVLGADFSLTLGDRWAMRGEFAHTRFVDAAPAGLGDFRYAVLGIERHVDGGWLMLAQYVYRNADRSPIQPLGAVNRAIWFQNEAKSDAVYLGLNRARFERNLSGDIGVLQTLDDHGRAWFANLEYRLDDQWSILARLQTFSGPMSSNLGALRENSLLLLELRGTWGWLR